MSNFEQSFPKQYDPKLHEDAVYMKWEKSGTFAPEKQKNTKGTYANILPPPNANGELHIGHALGHTTMDMIGRTQRLLGKKVLLLPGKDHAGIMTQVVFEKKIHAEQGKSRYDMGREEFYKQCYDFAIDRAQYMRAQEKKIGVAADWQREKFTLDPAISKTVTETFVRMFNDGLIYRGSRIINWCPGCKTSLSDLEVKYKKEKTKFYYLKYGPVVIGTARPETKFLDKVIVAHPSDRRYQKYFGKKIRVPWINGDVEATFIADASVDPKFGTGAMTITPAHSFEDFEIAQKHNLPVTQIIGEDGNFTAAVGPEFAGKNARASREEIIAVLQKKGLVDHVDENYEHNLSVCDRSGDAVEPLVSKQWFVSVDNKKFSLKREAAAAVRAGKVVLYPSGFKKIFLRWMDELHDWNISRQLWWGHQIPAFYCNSCKEAEPVVQTTKPKKCKTCSGTAFTQDPDTLDTWFSSGQWAYSTLGFSWSKKKAQQPADFKTYYPSDLMIMGRDILFFWSARMIMMSLYATRSVPFKRVYYTGLVRDKLGQKMSKSKNNGINPLPTIEKYGTDSLRLALLSNSSAGNDFRMYEEKIESFRNFTNKLWNIARFIEMRKDATPQKKTGKINRKNLSLSDKWILSRLVSTSANNLKDLSLDRLELSLPATRLYDFVWNDFADWYLEAKKIEDPAGTDNTILSYVLENILKMLHPYIPFVTEVLWEKTGHTTLLFNERYTKFGSFADKISEKQFGMLQEVIATLRSIRAEYHIDPKTALPLVVSKKSKLSSQKLLIEKLGRCVLAHEGETQKMISRVAGTETLFIDIAGNVDVAKELEKTKAEIARVTAMAKGIEGQLKNANFVDRAPKEIVEKSKEKLASFTIKLKEMELHEKELEKFQ